MDDLRDILRQVRRIEIRARQAVAGIGAGSYRSRFKGQGMEFDEVREYVPGDDVRMIDWNVTARSGRPYIKRYIEERDLTVNVLVDCSGSMAFGAIPGLSHRSKMLCAAEAAAVISVTAMSNNDQIGALAFAEETLVHLSPKRGRKHVMRLVREVLAPRELVSPGSPAHALQELTRVQRRHSVCFVISDFLGEDPELAGSLQQAARRHDVIALRISDPAEARLPETRSPLAIADLEGDEVRVLSGSRANRARYARAYDEHRDRVAATFRGAGCELIDITTDGSVVGALTAFFRKRRRRAA